MESDPGDASWGAVEGEEWFHKSMEGLTCDTPNTNGGQKLDVRYVNWKYFWEEVDTEERKYIKYWRGGGDGTFFKNKLRGQG